MPVMRWFDWIVALAVIPLSVSRCAVRMEYHPLWAAGAAFVLIATYYAARYLTAR